MASLLVALSLLLGPSSASAKDPSPVGVWNLDGAPYAELRADGTGTVRGEKVRWQAKAHFLALTYASGAQELMAYSVSGGKLTVVMNGQTQVFTKASGKPGKKAAKAETKAAEKSGAGSELASLLMSSP